MADSVRILGNLYSWASTSFKIDGEPFWGITDITFGDKRERAKGWGLGRHHAPRGTSAGKYTADPLKLTCFKDTAEAIRQYLAAKSPDGISWGNPRVPIVLQYMEGDSVITIEFEQCVAQGDTEGNSEGPDPLKEDVEFDVTGVKRNGLTLYDSSVE